MSEDREWLGRSLSEASKAANELPSWARRHPPEPDQPIPPAAPSPESERRVLRRLWLLLAADGTVYGMLGSFNRETADLEADLRNRDWVDEGKKPYRAVYVELVECAPPADGKEG